MDKFLNYLARGIMITSVCFSAHTMAAEALPAIAETQITVDIPVKLKEAKVLFNMDHIALAGDLPVGMKYMDLLNKKMKMDETLGKIIGIFHGSAAFMTLNDQSYNAERKVTTGNPYKVLIEGLIASGVQIEECAVSMKGHHWTNKDLLPGVKVNSGAIGRIIQLTQEGYAQIQP
ncbi:DsrE/DsrF-like family protein [mine drainage metagenome]|uniref:DsrE/DsrF-like family protein n=1 Tax=mine drainage metagenome TaxID=410659 RepID=A0A1J5RLX2_9ZZZZ